MLRKRCATPGIEALKSAPITDLELRTSITSALFAHYQGTLHSKDALALIQNTLGLYKRHYHPNHNDITSIKSSIETDLEARITSHHKKAKSKVRSQRTKTPSLILKIKTSLSEIHTEATVAETKDSEQLAQELEQADTTPTTETAPKQRRKWDTSEAAVLETVKKIRENFGTIEHTETQDAPTQRKGGMSFTISMDDDYQPPQTSRSQTHVQSLLDNNHIERIPGVMQKRALELFNQFHSLDYIIETATLIVKTIQHALQHPSHCVDDTHRFTQLNYVSYLESLINPIISHCYKFKRTQYGTQPETRLVAYGTPISTSQHDIQLPTVSLALLAFSLKEALAQFKLNPKPTQDLSHQHIQALSDIIAVLEHYELTADTDKENLSSTYHSLTNMLRKTIQENLADTPLYT